MCSGCRCNCVAKTRIKWRSAIATLRARPCEPSKGFVGKSGESDPTRESQRESQVKPKRDRGRFSVALWLDLSGMLCAKSQLCILSCSVIEQNCKYNFTCFHCPRLFPPPLPNQSRKAAKLLWSSSVVEWRPAWWSWADSTRAFSSSSSATSSQTSACCPSSVCSSCKPCSPRNSSWGDEMKIGNYLRNLHLFRFSPSEARTLDKGPPATETDHFMKVLVVLPKSLNLLNII